MYGTRAGALALAVVLNGRPARWPACSGTGRAAGRSPRATARAPAAGAGRDPSQGRSSMMSEATERNPSARRGPRVNRA